ncbi:putative phage associated protein [Brachyspira pilosicoli WesB]|uniref:Putative phage associated protein n=1 Tax=Brachyspira pilosicoli WesB TaxID=1161918 RepID=K0JGA5_BRAPL|nr:phage protein GemA/Gp16 family protein [Brachyspira pilosicoli]CCG55794.1 putative phage associated protein [Brachyspira pilosicoli WesB]
MKYIAKEKTKRQKMLAKIHIGKKYLGLNEYDYRIFLKAATGKESTKYMSIDELKEVLNSMNSAGFNTSVHTHKSKYFYVSAYDTRYLSEKQVKYIKGLWWQNAKNPNEETLRAFIKRITAKNSLSECGQKEANILITALQEIKK